MEHHSVCSTFKPGSCCCICKHHQAIYSHPWVNGLSTNHLLGWICTALSDDGHRRAMLASPHGYCELFEYAGSETPGIREQREENQADWAIRPKTALEIRCEQTDGDRV